MYKINLFQFKNLNTLKKQVISIILFLTCLNIFGQIITMPEMTVIGQFTSPTFRGADFSNVWGYGGPTSFRLPMPPVQNNANFPNPTITSGWGSIVSNSDKVKDETLSDEVENSINKLAKDVSAEKTIGLQVSDALNGKIDVSKFDKLNAAILPGSDSQTLKGLLSIDFKSGNSFSVETNSSYGGGTQLIGQWQSNIFSNTQTKVVVALDGSLGLALNTVGSTGLNQYDFTIGIDNINKDDGSAPGFRATLSNSTGSFALISQDGSYGVNGTYQSGAGSITGGISTSNDNIAGSIGYSLAGSSLSLNFDTNSNGSIIGQQVPDNIGGAFAIGLILQLGGVK